MILLVVNVKGVVQSSIRLTLIMIITMFSIFAIYRYINTSDLIIHFIFELVMIANCSIVPSATQELPFLTI